MRYTRMVSGKGRADGQTDVCRHACMGREEWKGLNSLKDLDLHSGRKTMEKSQTKHCLVPQGRLGEKHSCVFPSVQCRKATLIEAQCRNNGIMVDYLFASMWGEYRLSAYLAVTKRQRDYGALCVPKVFIHSSFTCGQGNLISRCTCDTNRVLHSPFHLYWIVRFDWLDVRWFFWP